MAKRIRFERSDLSLNQQLCLANTGFYLLLVLETAAPSILPNISDWTYTGQSSVSPKTLLWYLTFFGSHTSEESQSSWNSHYLRYWRRWTFLLYHRGIYSGTIHWHFCVISKNFPWTFNKIWHPALWYFRLSASFNAISNPISGSKTRAYYSMWKSDKINRFWNCIFFYRFWKKLSNLRNNGFCCARGSEWSSSNAFRRCVWLGKVLQYLSSYTTEPCSTIFQTIIQKATAYDAATDMKRSVFLKKLLNRI